MVYSLGTGCEGKLKTKRSFVPIGGKEKKKQLLLESKFLQVELESEIKYLLLLRHVLTFWSIEGTRRLGTPLNLKLDTKLILDAVLLCLKVVYHFIYIHLTAGKKDSRVKFTVGGIQLFFSTSYCGLTSPVASFLI